MSVMEELKAIYCEWCPEDCEDRGILTTEERMGCLACIGAVDAILSLKYPNGEPMIGVLSEDQSLPVRYAQGDCLEFRLGYKAAQVKMIDINFKRIA